MPWAAAVMGIAVWWWMSAALQIQNEPLQIKLKIRGAGLGFYMAKGFFDTIPKTIDEAAYIDGATKWQTFIHVTIHANKTDDPQRL